MCPARPPSTLLEAQQSFLDVHDTEGHRRSVACRAGAGWRCCSRTFRPTAPHLVPCQRVQTTRPSWLPSPAEDLRFCAFP